MGMKIDMYGWNKNDSPELNPHIYGHLFYDKGTENIQRTVSQ